MFSGAILNSIGISYTLHNYFYRQTYIHTSHQSWKVGSRKIKGLYVYKVLFLSHDYINLKYKLKKVGHQVYQASKFLFCKVIFTIKPFLAVIYKLCLIRKQHLKRNTTWLSACLNVPFWLRQPVSQNALSEFHLLHLLLERKMMMGRLQTNLKRRVGIYLTKILNLDSSK